MAVCPVKPHGGSSAGRLHRICPKRRERPFMNDRQTAPRTLYEKLRDAHRIATAPGHPDILYVDLHLLHDGTFRKAFDILDGKGLGVARPGRTVAVADHCVPITGQSTASIETMPSVVRDLLERCRQADIPVFGPGHEHQGIVHIIGPELGLTQPGMTIVCGDSPVSYTHLRAPRP